MSTGWMRSKPAGGSVMAVMKVSAYSESDVEEPDVFGVADDEGPPGLDVLAHQHAEQLVRGGRVVEGDQPQDPVGRVHRGLPQLLGVHLAEALVALDPLGLLLGQLAPAGLPV